MAMHKVFDGITDNATSGVYEVGAVGVIAVIVGHGTFGSGTLRLEFSPDDGTSWIALDDAGQGLTKAGAVNLAVPGMCRVRLNFSGVQRDVPHGNFVQQSAKRI